MAGFPHTQVSAGRPTPALSHAYSGTFSKDVLKSHTGQIAEDFVQQ
jgi:hypothetical protein